MTRTLVLLALLIGLGWCVLPDAEVEASSCLTRNNLVALAIGSPAPVICNQYGQLYAASVSEDGTQQAQDVPQSLIVPVRYESPYLYRTAGSGGLTCTPSLSPTTFPIGQAVPLACNQYGQLLVEVSGVGASSIVESTVAGLPGSPTSGTVRIVTDGDTASDCTTGNGSLRVLCHFNGSAWVYLTGGLPAAGDEGDCLQVVSGIWSTEACAAAEADTLDTVFDRGKTIDGANSVANAVRIGDGSTPICLYTDATLGPQVRPCTDANVLTVIPTNFTWALHDVEGAAAIETVDPDAASTLAMWTYGTAYRPKKSVWFGAGSLSTDGTQCAAPAEVTINSGPKIWTIICADNAASTIFGSVKMPDNWDGGTVTFEHVYIQTAADTGVLNGDIACQARSNGVAPSSTWGTEIAIDDAAVTGSNKNDFTTSAAVTCAGTPIAGDMLYWQYQLDTATTTAVATFHHVGFKMEYSETSRSQ